MVISTISEDRAFHQYLIKQILAYAHAQKNIKCCKIGSNWQKIMSLVLEISFLAIPMLTGIKNV